MIRREIGGWCWRGKRVRCFKLDGRLSLTANLTIAVGSNLTSRVVELCDYAKNMNRKELLRLMPRNAADLESARQIIDLGYPVIEPVHCDMIQAMRVAESPVADVFADYFGEVGASAVPAVAEGLNRENCWLRYRLFTRVLPFWSDSALSGLLNILTMVATQPDAYDNDVRCVGLLAERGLADIDWLAQWLEFKQDRMKERDTLMKGVSNVIKQAQHGIGPNT